MQAVDGLQQAQIGLVLLAPGLGQRDAHGEFREVGQELMQRRIDQADGHRKAVHGLKDPDEVLALKRQERVQCSASILVGVGEDEPLDVRLALAEEHVLGAQESDALSAHVTGPGRVLRRVGIRPHAKPPRGVRMGHDPINRTDQFGRLVVRTCQGRVESGLEVGHDRAGHHRHLSEEDVTGASVDGDDIALLDHGPRGGRHHATLGVDIEGLRPADGGLSHATRHDGRVRGLAATTGEDAGGGDHALQVVRVRLTAHQDDRLPLLGPGDRGRRVKDDTTHRCARRGIHALRHLAVTVARSEPREHQLPELVPGHPHEGLVHRDDALIDQLDGDAEGGGSGALADTRLQHPELASLNGELDVAQVAVVPLQLVHDVHELLVGLRVDLLEFLQRTRVADARDDVLALGIGEVVAVDTTVSRSRVAREGDPSARSGAGIAEGHHLHVHGGAQRVRNPLLPPVEAGALGVP